MRRAVMTLTVLAALAACASTPVGKFQQFTEAYTETLETLVELRDAGAFDAGDVVRLKRLTRAVDVAHGTWQEAVFNRDDAGAARAAAIARAALTELTTALAEWE